MVDMHDEASDNSSAIIDRLTRGEFRKAWDGIIGLARKALSRSEELDPRYEEREYLYNLINECIYAKGGDVSARIRTVELGTVYLNLTSEGRERFHDILAYDFDINRQELVDKIKEIERAQNTNESIHAEINLKKTLTPPRIILLKQFSSLPNGLKLLINMRAAILKKSKDDLGLYKLSHDIKEILAAWFDIGLLDLQEITWNSPAALLEKLIEYEAVHEIHSWDDLRTRLDSDRLCFAFFHNKMVSEPLIFVEVALVNKLSDNIQELLNKEDEKVDPQHANTALFYSISNTQPGLAGISMGNFLIKTVVQKLSNDFEDLKHFATLSPIPGFKNWLSPKLITRDLEILRPKEVDILKEKYSCENAALQLQNILNDDWYGDPATVQILQPILTRLCAHYLLEERSGSGAFDPVAHFHLSNGAFIERINWFGDLSENGKKRSYGLMVNYYYKLNDIDRNHEEYVTKTNITASRAVKNLLK